MSLLTGTGHWMHSRDGDPYALSAYEQHYSAHRYRDGRVRKLFVGPGQKMVLVSRDGLALFVWRKFRSLDHQEGINCAVFRNVGPVLSSELILEADRIGWERWPGERHYTYVDQRKIRSSNPGYCVLKAGWSRCGVTKDQGLTILEIRP